MFDSYLKNFTKNRFTIKAIYLLRDALKVVGLERLNFKPAELGVFYINKNNPNGGGTGHTIRICKLNNVQVLTQNIWLKSD